MLDPERDCLPQSEMTVRSMPKTLVPKGSLNGVVGIGYQLIKMIGKLTHTKEFALEVGRVVHGFSHQPVVFLCFPQNVCLIQLLEMLVHRTKWVVVQL